MGPASAFDGPNGHHQFVRFVAKDWGSWSVDMTLYDKDGQTVYTWHKTPHTMNSRETLWYTIGGGRIDGTIVEFNGPDEPSTSHPFHYSADGADGHCWLIDWRGARETGDTNGSCTPD
jgi:hypothetical protein